MEALVKSPADFIEDLIFSEVNDAAIWSSIKFGETLADVFTLKGEAVPEWATDLYLSIEGQWEESYAQTMENPADYRCEWFAYLWRGDDEIWGAQGTHEDYSPDCPLAEVL